MHNRDYLVMLSKGAKDSNFFVRGIPYIEPHERKIMTTMTADWESTRSLPMPHQLYIATTEERAPQRAFLMSKLPAGTFTLIDMVHNYVSLGSSVDIIDPSELYHLSNEWLYTPIPLYGYNGKPTMPSLVFAGHDHYDYGIHDYASGMGANAAHSLVIRPGALSRNSLASDNKNRIPKCGLVKTIALPDGTLSYQPSLQEVPHRPASEAYKSPGEMNKNVDKLMKQMVEALATEVMSLGEKQMESSSIEATIKTLWENELVKKFSEPALNKLEEYLKSAGYSFDIRKPVSVN